jgi:hypothetical protein
MRDYIDATLTTHKGHIYALREDPSYFADTILEYEQYAPYQNKQTVSYAYQCGDIKTYQRKSLMRMLDESFSMFAGWTNLALRLANLDRTFHDPDEAAQAHAVSEIKHVADWMLKCLTPRLLDAFVGAPKVRTLITLDSNKRCIPKVLLTADQHLLIDTFFSHFKDTAKLMSYTTNVTYALERVEYHMKKDPKARRMMSNRVLNLLTEISILSELVRQIWLWEHSPTVSKSLCDHKGCQYQLQTKLIQDFHENWMSGFHDFSLPIQHVYPHQEKLYWPAHKHRNQGNVNAMREAEQNLDRFWAELDAFFEQKSGKAKHRVLEECLVEGGDMNRTLPWAGPVTAKAAPSTKSAEDYIPLSRMVHNRSLQITGVFDKLSVEEKAKTKTRGTAAPRADANQELPAQNQDAVADHEPEHVHYVDRRTYKDALPYSSLGNWRPSWGDQVDRLQARHDASRVLRREAARRHLAVHSAQRHGC